jgi:hypothetical protein
LTSSREDKIAAIDGDAANSTKPAPRQLSIQKKDEHGGVLRLKIDFQFERQRAGTDATTTRK